MEDTTIPEVTTTQQDNPLDQFESIIQEQTTSNIVLVNDKLDHFYDSAPVSYVGQTEQTQAIQQVASELHVIRICLITFFIFFVVCKIFYSVKRFFNSLL